LVSLSSLNVVFEAPNILRHQQENARIVLEITSPIQAKIISELVAAADIECHLYCYKEPGQVPDEQTRRQRGKEAQPWYLNAILYGPSGLEEAIGEFLSKNQMYLQDPLGCDRRVPYRNPHVIPPETGEILMTDPLRSLTRNLEIERLDVGPDLLAKLMQDEAPLAETEAPDIVTTELYRFVPHYQTELLG
jgi:SWI/SNF-related matrix-associated actin-dependent regulator of chromatin subfamily A3